MKEGRRQEHPEKATDDELQKMPHTKARKFKPQSKLEPALLQWWQARKAHVQTITPRVAQYPGDESAETIFRAAVLRSCT